MAERKKYPEPFKRPGRPVYSVMLTGPDGKRRTVSTGETKKEAARQKVRELVDAAASRESKATFAEYAVPYFRSESCPHFARLREEGRSIGLEHLAASRRILDRLVLADPVFAALPVAQLRRGDLLDLRRRLLASGVPSNTANKAVAAAKTILSEAAFRGDIEDNVGARVGAVKYEKRERGVLLPAEVAALLAFAAERTRAIVAAGEGAEAKKPGALQAKAARDAQRAVRDELLLALLLGTGVRSGEARALRWGAIDVETGRCRIEEAVKGKDGLGLPKWGKVRTIALPRLVLDRLAAWRRTWIAAGGGFPGPEDFVFGDYAGKPLGYEGAHNVFGTFLEEAEAAGAFDPGDRWLSPHCARHSLNTNLLAAGVAPLLVQTYLGWSSAEAKILTRVQTAYTHLTILRVEDVAKAVDEIYTLAGRAGARKEAR